MDKSDLAEKIYLDLRGFDSWSSAEDLLKFLQENGYEFDYGGMKELADVLYQLCTKGWISFGLDGGSPTEDRLKRAFQRIMTDFFSDNGQKA